MKYNFFYQIVSIFIKTNINLFGVVLIITIYFHFCSDDLLLQHQMKREDVIALSGHQSVRDCVLRERAIDGASCIFT